MSVTTDTGKKERTYVHAAGVRIAQQNPFTDLSGNVIGRVTWEHRDATGLSGRSSYENGSAETLEGGMFAPVETDAIGNNMGTRNPYIEPPPSSGGSPEMEFDYRDRETYINGQQITCTLDGVPVKCNTLNSLLISGSVAKLKTYGLSTASLHELGVISTTSADELEEGRRGETGRLHHNARISTQHLSPTPGGDGGTVSTSQDGQNGISPDCIQALKDLDILDRVLELLKNPPLFDIDNVFGLPGYGTHSIFDVPPVDSPFFPGSLANAPGSAYFGTFAGPGETVGDVFRRNTTPGGAYTVRGGGSVPGIYYRGSQINLFQDFDLLLHEVVHLAFPPTITRKDPIDLDDALVEALDLTRRDGEKSSETVSRFFNNHCSIDLRFGNSQ